MGPHQNTKLCTTKENITKWKGNQTYGKIYLPLILQKRVWPPKYIKNSHNFTLGRQTIQLKNGQRTWTDTSPRRTYRGPRDIWKAAQYRQLSERCKLKPQWDTTYTGQNGHHKQINKQVLERMRRKGNPSALLVGMQTGAVTVENSMEFPHKTKNGTALWPSNSAAGSIP